MYTVPAGKMLEACRCLVFATIPMHALRILLELAVQQIHIYINSGLVYARTYVVG
jgi:hypothetical protein